MNLILYAAFFAQLIDYFVKLLGQKTIEISSARYPSFVSYRNWTTGCCLLFKCAQRVAFSRLRMLCEICACILYMRKNNKSLTRVKAFRIGITYRARVRKLLRYGVSVGSHQRSIILTLCVPHSHACKRGNPSCAQHPFVRQHLGHAG